MTAGSVSAELQVDWAAKFLADRISSVFVEVKNQSEIGRCAAFRRESRVVFELIVVDRNTPGLARINKSHTAKHCRVPSGECYSGRYSENNPYTLDVYERFEFRWIRGTESCH